MSQIILKLVSHKGNKATYAQAGSRANVRFATPIFRLGVPPAELPLGGSFTNTAGETVDIEFAPITAQTNSKITKPQEVLEAEAKLAAFRAEQKAAKEARMTPEQREKRDAKLKEREAEKARKQAERDAKKAKTAAPVKAAGGKRK